MKLKSKKGIAGTDIAIAVILIVVTIGIVTAIYVNTLNKSKDNMRYANAVRIATNIIETIQRQPYEYLLKICDNDTEHVKEVNGGNQKVFDTKIPNGYSAKITATPKTGAQYDIIRDVVVTVTYKSTTSYKTVTLNTTKQMELMDIANAPDFSLIEGYSLTDNGDYYYPINISGTNYTVTTRNDPSWYDYESGNYAFVLKSSYANIAVGTTGSIGSNDVYIWIPRFVSKSTETGKGAVQFLYGSSDYKIIAKNNDAHTFATYGIECDSNGNPIEYGVSVYDDKKFTKNDGLSGVWYRVGSSSSDSNYLKAQTLNSKIPCTVNGFLP